MAVERFIYCIVDTCLSYHRLP